MFRDIYVQTYIVDASPGLLWHKTAQFLYGHIIREVTSIEFRSVGPCFHG